MFTLTMNTRGQLVLPKEVRDRLKLLPGCKVAASIDEQGRLVLVPALYEPEDLIRDRPTTTRVVNVETMDDGIGRAVRRGRRFGRTRA
jgi:AbrB family looped-hinge helix DNA binding protein